MAGPFRVLVTFFAVSVLVLIGSSSWARDDRYRVGLSRFEFQGHVYGIYKIEICPQCWDGEPHLDLDILRFHATLHVLEQVQNFLGNVHSENALRSEGKISGMTQFILNSFLDYPDPFGRLQWSDAGRPLRKVDDYLNHEGIILVIAKNGDLSPQNILGTAKFVVSTPERLQAPIIQQYLGFVPLPLATPLASAEAKIDVEYENLARAIEGPNPIPLLLKIAIQSEFFKRLENKSSSIHLNSVLPLVDYHRRFGFKLVEGYYPGLPAARLSAETSTFVNQVQQFVSERLNSGHLSILRPEREPQPVDWERSEHLPAKILSVVSQDGFESLFCRALLARPL